MAENIVNEERASPRLSGKIVRVITFGSFDVFHIGHLNILNRAADLGDQLIVGVSTDQLSFNKKGRKPVYSESERLAIVSALRVVDAVFFEESLEMKEDYIRKHSADILVMGDDWNGRFDRFREICEVRYLARTPSVSTTATIEKIRS